MNTLEIKTNVDNELYHNLVVKRIRSEYINTWHDFIKSLDENITEVKCSWLDDSTTITFNNEIAKTFFILKYS